MRRGRAQEIDDFLTLRGVKDSARWLEVEDDVEGGLEIVLGLIEEGGVNPVGLAAHGKAGMQAVIEADARLHGKRAAAVASGLGLQVRAADETVHPRLEPVTPGADTDSAAAAEVLHMLVDVDCRSETRDYVAFDSEPAAREVADGGVGANETGVDNVRLEAVKVDAQAYLPAVIIAIAIDEIGFGSGRGGNRSGIGSGWRGEGEAARLAVAGLEQVGLGGAGIAESGGGVVRAAFGGRAVVGLLPANGTGRPQENRHSQDWLLHTDCPPPLVTTPPRRRGDNFPEQRILTRPPQKCRKELARRR